MPRLSRAAAMSLLSLVVAGLSPNALTAQQDTLPDVASLQQADNLMDAADAFAFSATMVSADQIQARWEIAQGYYMYRDRYQFEIAGQGLSIGEVTWPAAEVKHDEFFGETATYEGTLSVILPVVGAATEQTDFVVHASGQGCNEPVGVCYPPITHTVALSMQGLQPVASQLSADVQRFDSLASLQELLGGSTNQDFLDVDEAFKVTVGIDGTNTLLARITVADGYYLYRDKTKFESNTPGVTVLDFTLPDGVEKHDDYFGTSQVYIEDTSVTLPLASSESAGGRLSVSATYQGCAEQGICYPPVNKVIDVILPIAQAAGSANSDSGGDSTTQSFWPYVLAAFGIGLALTFTPCVLPMIPILSSIIAGRGETLSKRRGGLLASAYVLGTAVTYSAVGAVAGATGDQLQAYFQNPWAIGTASAMLALMALSMFGLYDIQVPSFIQSRLAQKTQRIGGGALAGTFVIGMMAALIVGACVSPLLISALGVAIAKADPYLGAMIMFSMALGMGVILIAVGIGAGFLLPKAGPWLTYVKQAFGVLLLAVSIYILGALPNVPVLLLWAGLLIISAVYLGATQAVPKGASNWRYLWKGVGTVMLIWGIFALIGGIAGSRDILRPLPLNFTNGGLLLTDEGPSANVSAARSQLFQRVVSLAELDRQLALAQSTGRPVILDYYADWCFECVRMERNTFSDPAVHREMTSRFILLQVDVTDPTNPTTRDTKDRFGVYGPPAMLFFDADGRERQSLRLYGYRNAEEFLQILRRV
ncbi:MAG: protein-disulfide reductase DsbD [Gammaproteobacteria bacterium]|nr:protein-disulfide reductase DsbD [Gammaproteobacteria bacterium]